MNLCQRFFIVGLVVDDFGSLSEANKRNLSLINHYILRLHVIISVTSFMNLLKYLKQLAAHLQDCVQSVPFSMLFQIFQQSHLILWYHVIGHQQAASYLINVIQNQHAVTKDIRNGMILIQVERDPESEPLLDIENCTDFLGKFVTV